MAGVARVAEAAPTGPSAAVPVPRGRGTAFGPDRLDRCRSGLDRCRSGPDRCRWIWCFVGLRVTFLLQFFNLLFQFSYLVLLLLEILFILPFLLPKCVLQSLDLLVFLTIGIWARAVVFWTRLAPIRIFDLPFAVFSHPFGLVFRLLCLVLSSSVAIASLAF